MTSLFDLFDRSYIINLPERRDRLKDMQWELSRVGISLPSDKVIVFPAIKIADKGEFPSPGAKGCFLSHLTILKEARDLGLKQVLILEDDLSFSTQFIDRQVSLAEELKELYWDFVYFGHILPVNISEKGSFQEYHHGVQTAHFYAVSGKVINRLVEFLEAVLERPSGHPLGGSMHVDGAYSLFRRQNPEFVTLIAVPSLGFQRASPSNISNKKWFDRTPILSQVAYAARQIKTWYVRRSM